MSESKSLHLSMRELMPFLIEEIKSGKEVLLTVKGISMQPFLKNNCDSVYLTALNGREIKVGDIVMFKRLDGSYAMHRVYKIHKDASFDIVGDNQIEPDRNVTYDMLVAFVPKVIRNGKTINCQKGFWRFLMIRFMKIRMKNPHYAWRLWWVISHIARLLKNPLIIFTWIKKLWRRIK